MPTPYDVAVIVGSLRANGFTRRIADALITRAPAQLALRIIPIDALQVFNQDEEAAGPQSHMDFKRALRAVDAVLFVTPEYNRGVPGCLKNATDIGSRPAGDNVFDGLPAAIVSQSPGQMGGMAANLALRPTLATINMPLLPQPEMYLSNAAALLDEAGRPASAALEDLMDRFLTAFASWVARNARPRNQKDLAA